MRLLPTAPRATWVAPAILVLLGVLVYSNTFGAEWVFDDFPHIVENPLVRDLDYFLHPERIATSGASVVARAGFRSRPVSLLTFSLNYRVHGLDVRGYHLVNLAIHLCAGLLLFHLLRRTLALPLFERSSLRPHQTGIAFSVAAIFLAHPLQTQAVTYVVQRMASLGGMLCLLSLAAYVEFRVRARERRRWLAYAVALAAMVAATQAKESVTTFPILIAGFEALFLAGPRLRRLATLLPLLATGAIVPTRWATGAGFDPALLGSALETIRANTAMPRLHYLFTQFGVVATYLRLLVWPSGQNLDAERPVYTELWQWPVLLPLALLVALAASAFVAIRRSDQGDPGWRLVGFGIGWFFVALSVESTLIPIADLLVEHRLYLPSAGIFLAAVAAAYLVWPAPQASRRAVTLGLVVLALAATAFERNRVWRTRLTIWGDAASKSPGKPRPRILYAGALAEAGRSELAIAEYRKAVELGPMHYRAWTNLGNLLLHETRYSEALAAFDGAIAAEPSDLFAHNGRGIALRSLGRRDEAIAAYREALRLDPAYFNARNNLGNALREVGRPDLAVRELETALRFAPDNAIIRGNLEQARREASRGGGADDREDSSR